MTKVSIIVLTYRNLGALRHMFESYLAHKVNIDHEFIMILNGATQEIIDYVDTMNDTLHKIYSESSAKRSMVVVNPGINLGVTGGRNLGMSLADGDYILFLDDDAVITADYWLDNMVEYFRLDPLVGIVGQNGCYVSQRKPGEFPGCAKVGGECDVVQGYCFMFSRKLMQEIGFLDTAYGMFWHEESDYCLNAKYHRYKVIDAGGYGVEHAPSKSGDDGTFYKKLDYLFRKWRVYFPEILVPRDRWIL